MHLQFPLDRLLFSSRSASCFLTRRRPETEESQSLDPDIFLPLQEAPLYCGRLTRFEAARTLFRRFRRRR